jgi:hypothetical protein
MPQATTTDDNWPEDDLEVPLKPIKILTATQQQQPTTESFLEELKKVKGLKINFKKTQAAMGNPKEKDNLEIFVMPQGTTTDNDWPEDDLEVPLKPIKILKATQQQPTTENETEKTQAAMGNPKEKNDTIESTDDGMTEDEFPVEPFIYKRKGISFQCYF